jgi:hypothetical protein
MAYREFQVSVTVADDSNKSSKSFDRQAYIYQIKDLESVSPSIRVQPADGDVQVSLGTITTGYAFAIFADYPIRVRLNGAGATQLIMHSNNVPATNTGAPAPPQCVFMGNVEISSIYVQPIVNAQQTANVWICVSGDPASAYV